MDHITHKFSRMALLKLEALGLKVESQDGASTEQGSGFDDRGIDFYYSGPESVSVANAEELAAHFPDTFQRPSRQEIESLVPGQAVKLIFEICTNNPNAPAAERMWLVIEDFTDDGNFLGRLDNIPYYIKSLNLGDRIEFAARFISAIECPVEEMMH